MDKKRKLIMGRIITPDGTLLESKHTHDYQEHLDANGEYYFVDGGSDYLRTSVNKVPAVDVSLYDDSPFEQIREAVCRGTFDKDGNRVWKPICKLSNNHLDNILAYNKERGGDKSMFSELVRREIAYRHEHGIVIEDDYAG